MAVQSLLDRLRSFLTELRRRKVYRVAVAYLAVAFVGRQAVDLLVPATTLPTWADEFLIALAVFGFLVALVLARAFEVTSEGVRRTADAEGAPDPESRMIVLAIEGVTERVKLEAEPAGTPGSGSGRTRRLQNLVENALTYHGEEPPRIRITGESREGGSVRVAVADDAPKRCPARILLVEDNPADVRHIES